MAPPHSRAQRRRSQQRRPSPSVPAPERTTGVIDETPEEHIAPAVPEVVAPRPASRSTRRASARPAPEPVNYAKDYAAASRDLRWIALWASLLFAAMIALRISGLV